MVVHCPGVSPASWYHAKCLIEVACRRLCIQKFRDDVCMGSSWWVTLNNFKDWLLSLNCLIHEVETDSMTLRNAVHITLPVLDALLLCAGLT